MINEQPSIFGDHIFELVDVDGSQGLDFSEFVTATMNFCMFGKDEVLKFCYYIFDKDRNGFIEEDELQDLVEVLHQDENTRRYYFLRIEYKMHFKR
eukprot:g3509.t1